ncbi:MAG: hypothetical protein ACLQUY_18085 [Ktedonobacterales bacterium]
MALKATARPEAVRPPRLRWLARWSRSEKQAAVGGLLLGCGLAYVYTCYLRGVDVSPDSRCGYVFAIAGTVLLALVGIGYTLRKRLRRSRIGLLHTALSWHMVGGILALALVLMHASGNFHPRTGTYALCSLIALVVSGIVGKQLDRIAPRLAAQAALKTVTKEGDERLEALVGALDTNRQTRPTHPKRREQRAVNDKPASELDAAGARWEPWDLAYYDLDAPPDQIPSLLHQPRPSSADPTPHGKGALVFESQQIRQAIGIEQLCLRLIRVWRYLHTLLSILTLVLILWHLEYVATLLLNAR